MSNPGNPNGSVSLNSGASNPRRDEICDFIDVLNDQQSFCRARPSDLLKAGWFAMDKANRKANPDWMAQSAHSFREVHYSFWDAKSFKSKVRRLFSRIASKLLRFKPAYQVKTKKEYIADSIKTFVADEARRASIATAINRVHGAFTHIAHHFDQNNSLKDTLKTLAFLNVKQQSTSLVEEESYEKLVNEFETLLLAIKPKSLSAHEQIDEMFAKGIFDEARVRGLCFSVGSHDAKLYFFNKADETWLSWIWEQGFFARLGEAAIDPTRYSYSLPELGYLDRMVAKDPKKVAKIVSSFVITKATLNPEVIDRFTRIISGMPVEQIEALVPKLHREEWVSLMAPFHPSGYEFTAMVEKLRTAKKFESLLTLTEVIFSVKAKEEVQSGRSYLEDDDIFYLRDISDSDIFDTLLDSQNDKKEESLSACLAVLRRITELTEEPHEVFAHNESFYLPQINLFKHKVSNSNRSYSREDLSDLFAVVTKLIADLFSSQTEARHLYESYIATLPDTHSLWRLKLYAITRCPAIFKNEIEQAFFRVFLVGERHFEIDGGAEYHEALIEVFGNLKMEVQRNYVSKVFDYYGADLAEKDTQHFRRVHGKEILDCIAEHLTDSEKKRAEDVFGEVPQAGRFIPRTSMSEIRSGAVIHQPPVNPTDFSVQEVINHLKTDWSPETLNEQFKDDDFLRPRGAEGLCDALKNDFEKRPDEYYAHLNNFFARDEIHPCYVYALFSKIDEKIRNKQLLEEAEMRSVVELINQIRISGELEEFPTPTDKSWLTDWILVHKIAADVLLGILSAKNVPTVFTEKRDTILSCIKYLLSIKQSPNEEDEKPEYGNPHHVAINSVRGQAYTALVQFMCDDGKGLAEDSKQVFLDVLENDHSRAVRFMLGHYVNILHLRDEPFIQNLLAKIFPHEVDQRRLYFAAWGGYLSNSINDQVSGRLIECYRRAIDEPSDAEDYPKELDEALAIHLALAYVHFDLKIGDPLFEAFWATKNEKRHFEFISFIGRTVLTRDQAGDAWFKKHNVEKQKIIDFWNWALGSPEGQISPQAFSAFGFWINPKDEVIADSVAIENFAKTLERAEGDIEWDYGFLRRLKDFAVLKPDKTLEMIKGYLLLNGELSPHRKAYFNGEDGVKEALEVIYGNNHLKSDVRDLINTLIEKGSSAFWGLKDILDN